MQERAEQEMPDFIPQGIGNFVWALGTLGMEPSEGLLAAIMVREFGTHETVFWHI